MVPSHDLQSRRFSLSFPEGEAVLDYEVSGRTVNFTHTLVPHELRGRGVAEALARAGLAWAKGEGLVIEADCSFVARLLERHPELR
jgi:predicted GNAT family acetyltransferase